MDPIADKLLTCSTLIVASAFGEVFWWVTILFLIREIGITVMRFFVIDTGGKVIAADKAGKYKTLCQCIGLGMLLVPARTFIANTTALNVYTFITNFLIYVALFLCLYSGAMYVYRVVKARRGSLTV